MAALVEGLTCLPCTASILAQASYLHVGHCSLTPSQRCRQVVWKKWLQGVTMRAPAWVTSSMLMQMTHSTPAGAPAWACRLGTAGGLQHVVVSETSEAQGAGVAVWVPITAAGLQLLLWVHGHQPQSYSRCCW